MKRILAFSLTMAMLLGMLPAATISVYAEETITASTDENFAPIVAEIDAVTDDAQYETTSEGLVYEIASDAVTITDYTGTASELTIPSTIEGYPVTGIGDAAFYFCDHLIYITLPDSVTFIGMTAFSFCSNLVSVTIPDGVTSINAGAFYKCSSLERIVIPNGFTAIDTKAFYECSSLKNITFAGNAPTIAEDAFDGVTASIEYPAGNSTWADVVGKDYGGTITWTAVGEGSGEDSGEGSGEGSGVTITNQPISMCVAEGEIAKVTVKAVGKDLTYQWYYKNPTASKFSKSSTTTSAYSVKMSAAVSGRQVYCVIKDSYGNSVKSSTVTLDQKVTIVTQPKSVSVAKGSTAKVTVSAIGKELTYTWYYKNPTATKFSKSSATTSAYSVKMSAAVSGRQVYCVIKDSYGNSVKTNTVTLKMK